MERSSKIPTICIAGRPNVGKSSLFNRLLGQRRAVVVEQSGTTRDRLESLVKIGSYSAKLIDTGGYMAKEKCQISLQVKDQIFRAMEESTVILFVVDSIQGVDPDDNVVCDVLRKTSKPVILVANKTDNNKIKNNSVEFYRLGFGDPVVVSCLHGKGMKKLIGKIRNALDEYADKVDVDEDHRLKIAVVGRPNVGKSSYINALLSEDRVIVSDVPGTTRDSIDTEFSFEGEDYILIDTAGIRHKRKIREAVDTYSIMRSRDSIERADVAVLIIDAADGVTQDDIMILKYIEEGGKPALIAVNKWDLAKEAEGVTVEEYEKHLFYASPKLTKYPLAFISCNTGKNIVKTLSQIRLLEANMDTEISTPYLNKIFEKNDPGLVPIPRSKKRPNFLYIVQSRSWPMEFNYYVNQPAAVLPAHLSYIENLLRENLPLQGIPVTINIKKSRKDKK